MTTAPWASPAPAAIPTPWWVGRRVWSQGPRDAHGNTRSVWGPPVPTPVHGVGPRVMEIDEPVRGNRSLVVEGLTVYAPAGTVVDARDRIVWPLWVDDDGQVVGVGQEYEVIGEPEDYSAGPWLPNPVGGVVIQMKRWEG